MHGHGRRKGGELGPVKGFQIISKKRLFFSISRGENQI